MRFGSNYIPVWLLKKIEREGKTTITISCGETGEAAITWFFIVLFVLAIDWLFLGMCFTNYVMETLRSLSGIK